jgi:hypothetical protein
MAGWSRSAAPAVCAWAALLLLLTACTTESPEQGGGPSETRIGDAVLAFYVSPQAPIADASGPAFVVLVDADGSTRSIETAGMDNGQLDWSIEGLHFADVDNDYVLGDDLRIAPSPKTDLQQAMFATEGSGSIGLYNEGLGSTGYVETVVLTDASGASSADVSGAYEVTAMCGGDLFGVAPTALPPTQDAEGASEDTGREELALARLSGTIDGGEEIIATVPDEGSVQIAAAAPCGEGIMRSLVGLGSGDGWTRSIVRSWDTATGEVSDRPLTDVDGRPLAPSTEDVLFAQYDEGSMRNGRFEWLAAAGRIMSTDPATGVTVERFAVGGRSTGAENVSSVFADDRIWIVSDAQDGEGTLTVFAYDRASGTEIDRFVVQSADGAERPDLVLRDAAARPAVG